jgi:hypothetical protein
MNQVADKLREARALIERGWVQKDYARSKSGKVVDPANSRSATCWCAAGAIGRVNGRWPNSGLLGMEQLSRAIGGDGHEADILTWNDAPERTQAEVLAAFDRAIELAEASA